MSNPEQLKKTAREYMTWESDFNGLKTEHTLTPEAMDRLDEIVTSTYLQAVWETGAWIEEQDFARKVAEKTGNAEAVYEMQEVIKKIQTKLQSLKQTKDDD